MMPFPIAPLMSRGMRSTSSSSGGIAACSVYLANSKRLLRTATKESFVQRFLPPKNRQHPCMSNRYFTSNNNSTTNSKPKSWWERWTAPREMPPRNTPRWYGEMILICTVFAITGTSTMVLVRPAVSNVLQLKGSLKDGPWSYRICSLVIMTPLYATLLVAIGTIFGRHAYFRHFAVKIFSRFGIPPELMDPAYNQTKATFRKW